MQQLLFIFNIFYQKGGTAVPPPATGMKATLSVPGAEPSI